MFGNIAQFVHEIVLEISAEVIHEPLRLVAEIVQFALLIGIVWVVAIGFGKRKGFVANMLTERQAKVAARLDRASQAETVLAEAKREATSTTRSAMAKARELVAQAKRECEEIDKAARAEADAECARITERAESALATEQQEMLLELREQLVELVSSATRSIMNEKLTVAEQRTLIENNIVGSMKASSKSRGAKAAAGAVSKGA